MSLTPNSRTSAPGNAAAPQSKAAALSYNEGDTAPRVVAKGRGQVAAQIVERAIAAGVPRIESQALADALVHVDIDSAIPPELYLVVAEVLAWVYRVDNGYRKGV
jgi:flagellar biosynthesis protein